MNRPLLPARTTRLHLCYPPAPGIGPRRLDVQTKPSLTAALWDARQAERDGYAACVTWGDAIINRSERLSAEDAQRLVSGGQKGGAK